MNYVQQAFSLSNQQKQKAHALYIESVKDLVNKNYVSATADAFTDLSAIFGMKWVMHGHPEFTHSFDRRLYAEANIAFNYASMHYHQAKDFFALAKRLVPSQSRISNRRLRKVASQMNCLLTATTPEAFSEALY